MRKLISVIICIITFFASINTSAIAYQNESLIFTDYIEDSWIVDVKDDEFIIRENVDKRFYQQCDNYAVNYNCYQFLDEAQKVIYDSILANIGKLSFTIYFDDGVFLYSNFTKDYFTKVMMALCTDRPDLFYYAGYGINGGTLHNDTYIDSVAYVVSVYDSNIYTDSNLPMYCSALMEKVSQVPVNTENRYLFIKSVHDFLAQTVYYPDLNSTDYVMSAHDAYGALVEGRAVCQGYSDALKLICDYYKIPCVCISGESDGVGHMWNAVLMEDGMWYLIDVTWDDQSNKTYYDFFLVGLNSIDTFFGMREFNTSHVSDVSSVFPLLNYATDKYNESNHNTGFKATYNSITKEGNYLIRSFFDVDESYVYYNGMYVDTNTLTTNGKFNVPSSENGENWTLVLLGDCNGDGECSALDYSDAVNTVVSGNAISTAYDMAIDIDCDGYLDVLDLGMMQLLVNGFATEIDIE